MNKRILILVVIVIIIGGYFLYQNSNNTNTISNNNDKGSSTIQTPVTLKTAAISGAQTQAVYTNTKTGQKVTFVNKDNGGRSSNYDVLVDNNSIGSFEGLITSIPAFTPDNSYLSFEINASCGAACESTSIGVVNFATKKFILVNPPKNDSSTLKSTAGHNIFPYIESYSWDKDSLNIVAYSVMSSYNEAKKEISYDRVSPKQNWSYNLTSGKYTLVKTLSE